MLSRGARAVPRCSCSLSTNIYNINILDEKTVRKSFTSVRKLSKLRIMSMHMLNMLNMLNTFENASRVGRVS
jgi:hypothetical protein